MDIKFWHCLLFAYVFVAEATKLKINIRYNHITRHDMDRNSFENNSMEYNKTKLAVEGLETESCTNIITEAGNNDCSLHITYVGIEPMFILQAYRVVLRVEFRFINEFDLTTKAADLPQHYIRDLVNKYHPSEVATLLNEIVTDPLPAVCQMEYDRTLGYTWPASEDHITHSVMYPSEKPDIIRYASRKCLSNGWDRIMLITWTGHILNCTEVGRVLVSFWCHPQNIKHLPNDNDELEQILNSILSGFDNESDTKLTAIVNKALVSFVHLLMDTTHNLTTILLKRTRNSIKEIVRQHSLSDGDFQFRSSNLAMMIDDIKELASAGSIAYFKIPPRNGAGILGISLDHDDSDKPNDIVIPVKSILNSVNSLIVETALTIDRVGLCVFKDAFLFRPADNVFSRVYSILIPGTENVMLKDNIKFTFAITKNGKYNRRCVFWDPNLNIGGGGWSTNGCRTILKSDDLVECQCTHLSSFALMTLPAIHQEHVERLNYISIIGCTISAVSLILTLITYFTFKSLTADIPSKILVIICINLLCTNLLYILNVVLVYMDAQKSNETGEGSFYCKGIAVLFHYFLLASLAWMGANGYFMYKSLVDVFGLTNSIIWRLAVFASGLPFFIVMSTVMIDFNSYYGVVKEEICWLKDGASIFSFIIPVALITTYNLYIFFLVFHKIRRITKTDANKKTIVTQFKGGLSITVLLGLTWGFAFMAIGWGDIIFAYLFVICNSFQGFFLFLFYCVFKEKTRDQWLRCCRRMKKVKILTATSKTHGISTTSAVGEQMIAGLTEDLPIPKWPTTKLKRTSSINSTTIY